MYILPITGSFIGTNSYQNINQLQKTSKTNNSTHPAFNGYREVFQDVFCQKFSKKYQAEEAYSKLVETAMTEFKDFPVSLYLLSKGRNLAVEIGNYTLSHEERKLPDEKVYHNNNLVVLGGAIGVHFYDSENPKRWVSFYSNNSNSELDVMQMHENGFDNYLFWHSDKGNLKKHIHNSNFDTKTTHYNLDGSKQDLTDRFKRFFGL